MSYLKFDLERDELSQRFGGGLPRGALCVIAGKEGAGKSVLSQRMAFGALQRDARVAYVSTELGMRNFLEQMRNLGYPVENEVLAGKFALYSTHPGWKRAHARPQQLHALLASRIPESRDLVFVDRISSLLRDARSTPGSHAMLDRAVERLLSWARAGRTVVLTVDPTEIDPHDFTTLLRVTNVYLDLRTQMMGPQAMHIIEVKRYERPLARVADMVVFRVEPRVGFMLEIKAVY